MRNRSFLLILFAALFAAGPYLQNQRIQAQCTQQYNPSDDSLLADFTTGASPCPYLPAPPLWTRVASWMALAFAVAAGASMVAAWRDRRRERDLLRAAGIHVREQDLPLEP